jgi:hypothetical protein
VTVSMTVVVAGTGVSVVVSKTVTDVGPEDAAPVGPPSTGTTEYVALLTTDAESRGTSGNDDAKISIDENAESAELERWSRMVGRERRPKTSSAAVSLQCRNTLCWKKRVNRLVRITYRSGQSPAYYTQPFEGGI